jgi:hypothetical protein
MAKPEVQEVCSQFCAYVCPDCGYRTLSPPRGRPCILCLVGRPDAIPLVMRSEAEALAEALEAFTTAYMRSDDDVFSSALSAALQTSTAYRARHPKETS